MQEVAKQARNELLNLYNTIYNDLYENDYTYDLLEKGEKLLKNKALYNLLFILRGDLLTSDREIAAYYLWAKKSELI